MERYIELIGMLFDVIRTIGLALSGVGFFVSVHHYYAARDGQDRIIKWAVLFVAILISPAILTLIYDGIFS